MFKLNFICLLFLSLSGCVKSVDHWSHNDSATSSSQQERDIRDCEYQAKLATASASSSEVSNMGAAVGQGINIAETRIELENTCMTNKGYIPR